MASWINIPPAESSNPHDHTVLHTHEFVEIKSSKTKLLKIKQGMHAWKRTGIAEERLTIDTAITVSCMLFTALRALRDNSSEELRHPVVCANVVGWQSPQCRCCTDVG